MKSHFKMEWWHGGCLWLLQQERREHRATRFSSFFPPHYLGIVSRDSSARPVAVPQVRTGRLLTCTGPVSQQSLSQSGSPTGPWVTWTLGWCGTCFRRTEDRRRWGKRERKCIYNIYIYKKKQHTERKIKMEGERQKDVPLGIFLSTPHSSSKNRPKCPGAVWQW